MFTANRLARSGRSCWARREARSCCQSLATAVGSLSVVQALARTCVCVYTGVVRKSTHTARTHTCIDTRFSGIQTKQVTITVQRGAELLEVEHNWRNLASAGCVGQSPCVLALPGWRACSLAKTSR